MTQFSSISGSISAKHVGMIHDATFDESGSLLATIGADNKLIIQNIYRATGELRQSYSKHSTNAPVTKTPVKVDLSSFGFESTDLSEEKKMTDPSPKNEVPILKGVPGAVGAPVLFQDNDVCEVANLVLSSVPTCIDWSAMGIGCPDGLILIGQQNGQLVVIENLQKIIWTSSPIEEYASNLEKNMLDVKSNSAIIPHIGITHTSTVIKAKWISGNEIAFVSASSDGSLILWQNGKSSLFEPIHQISSAHSPSIIDMDISENMLCTVGTFGDLKFWTINNEIYSKSIDTTSIDFNVTCSSFRPGNLDMLGLCDDQGNFYLGKIQDGSLKLLFSLKIGEDSICRLSWTLSGASLSASLTNGDVIYLKESDDGDFVKID